MKISTHQIDIYGTTSHLAKTPKSARKLGKEFSVKGFNGQSLGSSSFVYTPDGETHVLLFVDVKSPRNAGYLLVDTAAHEAAHAAGLMAGYLSLSTEDSASEHYAYLIGHITGWIYREATDPQDVRSKS